MSVILGGVDLDSRLLLRGGFESPSIAMNQKRLLSGDLYIETRSLSGRTLSLSTDGPNNVKYGLFSRSKLTQIAVLRDAGVPVSLVHGAETFSVVIPDSGLSVEPLVESTNKNEGDLYTGTITLIEVFQ